MLATKYYSNLESDHDLSSPCYEDGKKALWLLLLITKKRQDVYRVGSNIQNSFSNRVFTLLNLSTAKYQENKNVTNPEEGT